MPTRFESSPADLATLHDLQTRSKPICTIAAYRCEREDEIIFTVNVKMERTTPELDSSDYHFALDAIADSIRNIQSGRLKPASVC